MDMESQVNNSDQYGSAIFRKASRPFLLKFEDVVYKIRVHEERLLKKQKGSEEKVILKGVTGVVQPGEMLAMLGPSGCGKTTLLTALGGRLGGILEGSITYNGEPFSNPMKKNIGFVTQDDVLYPHLTVTETLVFTALLRLPNTLTKQDKVSHAEAVIRRLGLTECKNSIIGDSLCRGISGGERKRVSVGQEMLINPSLLFLDEPTSGLDSTTARRLVSTLSELATGGRTVVMTIHQPSSRLFYLFHKVLLLSEGNPLYFGHGSEVMDYFANIGYAPAVAMNPADFLLDLANGVSADGTHEEPSGVKQALISAYKSNLADQLKAAVSEVSSDAFQDCQDNELSGRWATTWCQQFIVLLRRGLKERRHESFSKLKVVQILCITVIAGLLWWRSDTAHLQDQLGLLFFSCAIWSFVPVSEAISTFPQERMMLEKERSSGMYRLSSYFMSLTVGDLPMELVLPAIFSVIIYWMGGLKPEAACFFIFMFVILCNVLVSQGIGLALGALLMDQKAASTLGSIIMLAFSLSAGYYVQHVPPFIGWIKHVSLIHHSLKLLLGSQYKPDEKYPCATGSDGYCLIGDYPAIKQLGLNGQGISAIAVVLMIVGYRLIAYIALMRIGVPRK